MTERVTLVLADDDVGLNSKTEDQIRCVPADDADTEARKALASKLVESLLMKVVDREDLRVFRQQVTCRELESDSKTVRNCIVATRVTLGVPRPAGRVHVDTGGCLLEVIGSRSWLESIGEIVDSPCED